MGLHFYIDVKYNIVDAKQNSLLTVKKATAK